jgi:hypothetical protein
MFAAFDARDLEALLRTVHPESGRDGVQERHRCGGRRSLRHTRIQPVRSWRPQERD